MAYIMGKRKRVTVSKVVWLPEALEDTQRLRLFLDEKNPTAAARVGKILQEGEKYLASFPEIGRL